MTHVQPITITVERTKKGGGAPYLRTKPLDGPCRHEQVDYRRESATTVDVLCVSCGHGWKSVRVEP